jgi:RimJ/RimL family protein N-acetyltransferase
MVKLRPVVGTDLNYFSKWWRDEDLLRVTSGKNEALSNVAVANYFRSIKTTSSALHFMVDTEDGTIGHVSLQQREEGWWETQIVIGEKTAQGKGFGPEAIKLLLEKAREQRINQIYLEVRPENVKAIGAYEKVGFSRKGDTIFTGNPDQPELIRMEFHPDAMAGPILT